LWAPYTYSYTSTNANGETKTYYKYDEALNADVERVPPRGGARAVEELNLDFNKWFRLLYNITVKHKKSFNCITGSGGKLYVYTPVQLLTAYAPVSTAIWDPDTINLG
jgi:hypothetical protein